MVLCLLDQVRYVAAGQQRKHHVRLACSWLSIVGRGRRFDAEVIDGRDVRMVAEAAHGLGLASDALSRSFVEAFGLDEGEGDVAVEEAVVGEVDLLLATFAQEAAYGVAAVGEGGGENRRLGRGGHSTLCPYGIGCFAWRGGVAQALVSSGEEGLGVGVIG